MEEGLRTRRQVCAGLGRVFGGCEVNRVYWVQIPGNPWCVVGVQCDSRVPQRVHCTGFGFRT